MEKSLGELGASFRQGLLSRRDFVRQATLLAGGAGAALVAGLTPEARAARAGDILIEEGTYKSGENQITYYLARPAKDGPFPTMIVIHEIFGLSEFIKDVVRLFASAGYLAMAPSLSEGGGRLPDGKHAPWMLDTLRTGIALVGPTEITKLLDGHAWLAGRKDVDPEHIGSVGFCWGGARSFTLATVDPDLWAAIVFYGSKPPDEAMETIEAPVLGLYGATDINNLTSPSVTAPLAARTMRALNKTFEWEVYSRAPHGFFRDGNSVSQSRAAGLAWELVNDFLGRHY